VLCLNFVKFGQQEIGKVVHYLPEKKLPAFLARGTAWIVPKICQGRSPNVLRVLQISSKSVHFWRSSRTCEHHTSALESESNIWLKPNFEPNNNINAHSDTHHSLQQRCKAYPVVSVRIVELKFSPVRDWWSTPLEWLSITRDLDLDLGSGHTAYGHAIDLYVHTKFH